MTRPRAFSSLLLLFSARPAVPEGWPRVTTGTYPRAVHGEHKLVMGAKRWIAQSAQSPASKGDTALEGKDTVLLWQGGHLRCWLSALWLPDASPMPRVLPGVPPCHWIQAAPFLACS